MAALWPAGPRASSSAARLGDSPPARLSSRAAVRALSTAAQLYFQQLSAVRAGVREPHRARSVFWSYGPYLGLHCDPSSPIFDAKRPLMTQHSEERLPETEGAPSGHAGARILPFERPQSELQRAVQQRAQEALDLDRERDREKRRPQPLKWLAIFALACIPVLLTVSAVDGFLRVFHKIVATYSSEPAPAPAAATRTERRAVPAWRGHAGVVRHTVQTRSAARQHRARLRRRPPMRPRSSGLRAIRHTRDQT